MLSGILSKFLILHLAQANIFNNCGKLFNTKYKNNKFYGKEYFEGDKDDMILTIKKYVRNKYPLISYPLTA